MIAINKELYKFKLVSISINFDKLLLQLSGIFM